MRLIFSITDHQMEKDNHKVDHLNKLKDLNIDLTSYLTNQQPPQVAEELQVVTAGTSTQF